MTRHSLAVVDRRHRRPTVGTLCADADGQAQADRAQADGPGRDRPAPAQPTPGAGPVVVVETTKGTFEFETYPNEAPRTVEHILALVKKNFYNGLRFHRVEPGFVIQVGDPNTRDYTKKALWGTGGSGTPVGLSELSRKRLHVKGAVAMAHSGNPATGRRAVVRDAQCRAAARRQVRRVRPRHQRARRHHADSRGRRHSKNVREAVNGATSTSPSSSG